LINAFLKPNDDNEGISLTATLYFTPFASTDLVKLAPAVPGSSYSIILNVHEMTFSLAHMLAILRF
jgi:hypothetical protein